MFARTSTPRTPQSDGRLETRARNVNQIFRENPAFLQARPLRTAEFPAKTDSPAQRALPRPPLAGRRPPPYTALTGLQAVREGRHESRRLRPFRRPGRGAR